MADVPFVESKEIPCLCGSKLEFIESDTGDTYVHCPICKLTEHGGSEEQALAAFFVACMKQFNYPNYDIIPELLEYSDTLAEVLSETEYKSFSNWARVLLSSAGLIVPLDEYIDGFKCPCGYGLTVSVGTDDGLFTASCPKCSVSSQPSIDLPTALWGYLVEYRAGLDVDAWCDAALKFLRSCEQIMVKEEYDRLFSMATATDATLIPPPVEDCSDITTEFIKSILTDTEEREENMSKCSLDSIRCMCGGKILSTKVDGVHKAVCADCATSGQSDKSWGEAVGRFFLAKVQDYPEDSHVERLVKVIDTLYAHEDCPDCGTAVSVIAMSQEIGIYDVGIKGEEGEKGPSEAPSLGAELGGSELHRKITQTVGGVFTDPFVMPAKQDFYWLKTNSPSPSILTDSQVLIAKKCDELKELLLEKNRKYGDSAINPCRVFSKASATEQILVRMDDKINRIKNRQNDEDEDVIKDLAGYCILYMIAKEKESE